MPPMTKQPAEPSQAAGSMAATVAASPSSKDLQAISIEGHKNSGSTLTTRQCAIPDNSSTPNKAESRADWLSSIALVDRMLEMEDRQQKLAVENLNLKSALNLATAPGSNSEPSFDVPRTGHPWPLADNSGIAPEKLGQYDRRCDDDVLIAGRTGTNYLARYNLLGESPDYVGAIKTLNSEEPKLVTNTSSNTLPDVSIVIPVYGQLAYTLNCLHSLLTHHSQFTAEIVIVDDASTDRTNEFLSQLKYIQYHRQEVNGGFIQSCNKGGQISRGRYLVMLNNDTRVAAGWLDSLVGSFDIWPKAGLVGSKMLYADGRLQEAGGIIWRDGSAWNYGRNDDPNRPHYSCARQVDYVSGCSIAMPAALWAALGGFDSFYEPAYCEDVDLAFRTISSGHEVWFQPLSRVIHYEGKTSGTSTASGIKAYQIINTKKLYFRWRKLLEGHRRHGEMAYLERERYVKRRMLVVDATTPTPDQDAGSVQTYMALQTCVALGYKTHFVPENNWLYQDKYTPALQRIGVECAYAPFESGFESYIRQYGKLFDMALVYRIGVLEKVLPLLRIYAPQAAIMFHLADLHYLRMERTAQLTRDSEMEFAAAAMKERELFSIQKVDCTISHSRAEVDILAQETPLSRVIHWPLMAEFFGTKSEFKSRRDLCFLGGYRHPPNVDAVLHFVNSILPIIHAHDPEIRFIIAGAYPPDEIRVLAGSKVIITGMVKNLRNLFDPCRVFVCPLRTGAGVKGKIASALSYGIPVVSTNIGVEGSDLEHGKHVLVADTPSAFADAVLRVYSDPVLWGRLAVAGQDQVRSASSFETGKKILNRSIDTAIAHKLGLNNVS